MTSRHSELRARYPSRAGTIEAPSLNPSTDNGHPQPVRIEARWGVRRRFPNLYRCLTSAEWLLAARRGVAS